MKDETPAAIAASLEESPQLPDGDSERFVGYGVMAAPFASGDVLAMRRFPKNSIGGGYSAVWHRARSGEWTIYADAAPRLSCARYFGSALARAIETPISVSWPAPDVLEVEVPAAGLSWTVQLEQTSATRFFNRVGRTLPDRMWRNPTALGMMSRLAARVLHSGRMGLAGHAPNGQAYVANPMRMWLIRSSHARIDDRDLGELAPLAEQVRLGDWWIPQRGLFAFGRVFLEPLDLSRHKAIMQTQPTVSDAGVPAQV